MNFCMHLSMVQNYHHFTKVYVDKLRIELDKLRQKGRVVKEDDDTFFRLLR